MSQKATGSAEACTRDPEPSGSACHRTIMGPYGINRAVHRFVFSDCENGLGIKVIGGFKEQSGEEYGIYVKRVLQRGIAASDGRLQAGDLILEVNGEDLAGVTNERAVDILRTASASNHMSLLVARDDESRREFVELMEKYGSHSNAGSARSSPTPHTSGRTPGNPSTSSGSPGPKDSGPLAPVTLAAAESSAVQLISVPKGLGLGINIVGGTDKPEGPMVCVQEVIPGGECHKDGRLQAGDQLVSINKESLIGVTHQEAKSILTRLKLRPEIEVELAFMRRCSQPDPTGHPLCPGNPTPATPTTPKPATFSLLLPPANHRHRPAPRENIDDTAASTSPGKSVGKKSDHSLATSPTGSFPNPSSPVHVPSAWTQPTVTRGRSLSLNPSFRLKVEKLEMALGYLGIEPTEQQQQSLRHQLQVDSMGTVAYGDFVQAARDMFRLQLNETVSGEASESLPSSATARLSDAACPVQTPPSRTTVAEDLERITQERNKALKELKNVKDELSQSERSRKQLNEELHKVRQEVKGALEEGRCLRKRVHLSEAVQRQARGMESDYEEVIRLLQAEITELKAQLDDPHGQTKDDGQELRKRVAVLDCQLRKSEIARKTFEVSTEKLLQFVEMVHELLADSPAAPMNVCARRLSGPALPQNMLARLGHSGPRTLTSLSIDAQELAKSVRSVIEAEREWKEPSSQCLHSKIPQTATVLAARSSGQSSRGLPYGWEEAYTADGIKYFIKTCWKHSTSQSACVGKEAVNKDSHVTQTTSWIHPVTSALACTERTSEVHPRNFPEFKS
ncbi:syntaxin-binding protein 4 isoform X4 [Narcine bancroftii]|uniref:syntaxin-binding protein 4 isoform X4 n=1 Tax=Narcine bancroftii TaxID=1343680 RepID=UPI0038322205